MYKHTHALFDEESFPFWLGLLMVVVLPFLSIYRVRPLNSFYLEAGSLLGVLLLVVFSIFSGSLKANYSRATWYFLALSVFWFLQARFMNLTYVGLSDMVVWTYVILALGVWAVNGWCHRLGWERALSLFACALVVGCFLQSVIGWLQYSGLATYFSSFLMYRQGIVEGQLAQRNHLGHYLMWGVLSAAWLGAQRRLPIWLVAFLMAFFASVMALTGSRTILAYVLVMLVLLPVVGVISGSLLTRTSLAFFLAALLVLVFQLSLEPLLSLFQSDVNSAVERLNSSHFDGSGRYYEWRKAWAIFLSAPWFGHGWGSYSLQGFLTNLYPSGFRPYENNVLFTHSHNSLLNLLAEMGLVGTLLVVGGLCWVLMGCLKREHNQAGLFVLALLSVSLTHSLLEYPLWYIYFLSVFALIIGFAPPTRTAYRAALFAWQKWGVLACSVVLMLGIIRLGVVYQELKEARWVSKISAVEKAEHVVTLLKIAKTEPMLRYYAELELMYYVDANQPKLFDWAAETARNALTYRPFPMAYKWGLLAAHMGQIDLAREWMKNMYRYYPSKFQTYGEAIMKTPDYAPLRADYEAYCRLYFQSIQQPEKCVRAPLSLWQTK